MLNPRNVSQPVYWLQSWRDLLIFIPLIFLFMFVDSCLHVDVYVCYACVHTCRYVCACTYLFLFVCMCFLMAKVNTVFLDYCLLH